MRGLVRVALVVVWVLLVSCRKHDIRAVTVGVPEMKNKACATVVANAVSRLHGVKVDEIRLDMANRTVTVTYDSMLLALKNIEFAIADAGFAANEVPAKPEALKALPPECTR